jgi:hypothetical protein
MNGVVCIFEYLLKWRDEYFVDLAEPLNGERKLNIRLLNNML